MASFINLLGNDIWSQQDILNRCRAVIESTVSAARQNELRTIMLGHISQLRTATAAEMEEIMLVKTLTEEAADMVRAATADMELLSSAMAVESAMARISLVVPETEDENVLMADTQERSVAQAVIDSATQNVLDLVGLRAPPPEEPLPEEENY